jgi:myo-inositol catabolism protein IolC
LRSAATISSNIARISASERRRDQVAVLAGLFAIAREVGAHTLLELLVPAEGPDAQLATTDPDVYRSEVLPVRLADSVRQLADAGIVPDLWKIDGLDRSGAACVVGHAVAEVSDGRAGIVVLGAGRDVAALVPWFAATANQPNFCGFAVGRSIWWPPLHRHLRGELDTEQTELAIGDAFADVVRVYEEAVG